MLHKAYIAIVREIMRFKHAKSSWQMLNSFEKKKKKKRKVIFLKDNNQL